MHYTDEDKFKVATCWIDLSVKKYCSLPYCINNKIINKNLSFFVFPKNRGRCEKWLSGCERCYLHGILERYGPSCLSMCCLCEEHFDTSQFTDFTFDRLISDAVPTLFEVESAFCQRINAETSGQSHPCSPDCLRNLLRKERCVQRLMPLFPNLKIYRHPFLHDLPRNLTIRKSNHSGARYGVWSIDDIPIGTRYGPYDTIASLPNPKKEMNVQYFHKTDQQKYVEKQARTGSTLFINWLQYINLACNQMQQNLLIYQCQGKIYYLCYKPIPANTELLVWYGPYHTYNTEEKKEYYISEELVASGSQSEQSAQYHKQTIAQGPICRNMERLVNVLGIQRRKTKCAILKHAIKELKYVKNRAIQLKLEKLEEQRRSLFLREQLLSLTGEYHSMEELETSVSWSSFCYKHRTSREYTSEISRNLQNLVDVLGVEGKRTEKEILQLATKELSYLRRTSVNLSLKKTKEQSRCQILKKQLLFLKSSEGYDGSNVDKLETSDISRSIRQEQQISSEYAEPQEICYSIQELANVLDVEGRTEKEILDLAVNELKCVQETAMELKEKKSIEERKHRLLKRRLFLISGEDSRNSVMEPSSKYCLMCEHNYAYHRVS